MPGPRAVQNLQMPRRRGWQGRKMPRSSPGGLGAGGIDWCTMFYLPLSLSFLFSHLSTILLFSFLNFFLFPPPQFYYVPSSSTTTTQSTTTTFLLFFHHQNISIVSLLHCGSRLYTCIHENSRASIRENYIISRDQRFTWHVTSIISENKPHAHYKTICIQWKFTTADYRSFAN